MHHSRKTERIYKASNIQKVVGVIRVNIADNEVRDDCIVDGEVHGLDVLHKRLPAN